MSGYSGTLNEATTQQDYMRTLFSTLRRRWFFIGAGTIVSTIALGTAVQFLPKSYQGVASVEVLAKTPTVANPDIVTGDQVFTDETAGTELGIFTSQELRTAVIQKLGLLDNPDFNPDIRPSLFRQALVYLEQAPWMKPLYENASFSSLLPSVTQPTRDTMMFDTVTMFTKNVVIEPVSHSKIIRVTATARDPQLAARIANVTVSEYVAAHQQQKEDAYKQAYDFTKQRLPALRADMVQKSDLVNQFRQKNNMVSGQYAMIRREKLTEASRQLVDAQNHLETLRAQLAEAKRGDIMSNPAVLASLTIERLREQESQLAAEGVGHPTMAPTYLTRVQSIEASIRAEAQRVIGSLPNQVAVQEQAVRQQAAAVEANQSEVSRMDTLQSQLDPLLNDATVATKQYNDFLSSDSVSRPDVAFTAVNVRILSAAAIPYQPHFPDNKVMLPAAFALSLLGMCGLALYRGRRVGFANSDHFQTMFQIEPIGKIPMRTKSMEQAYWEAVMFLSMRLSPPYSKTQQTILITSAQPDEGKTTIAHSLAMMLAKRRIKVALVDADLRMTRRPSGDKVIGLREVLSQEAPLEQVMSLEKGVTVINAGNSRLGHPTSLIASDAMPKLLDQLRETHDIVIIDGPPAPVGGDSWALSKLVDKVLCVVKQSETGEQEVENVFRSLGKQPAEIGVVLNMIQFKNDPAFARLQYGSDTSSSYFLKG